MAGGWEDWEPAHKRYYARLGKRIIAARHQFGWTQALLAKKVKLSRGSVANIERGKQRLLIHQLVAFAKVLKLDIGGLLP